MNFSSSKAEPDAASFHHRKANPEQSLSSSHRLLIATDLNVECPCFPLLDRRLMTEAESYVRSLGWIRAHVGVASFRPELLQY